MTLLEVRKKLKTEAKSRGSQKAAAKSMGVSAQYFGDVLMGVRDPGPKILLALGIERIVNYRPISTEADS